MTYMHALLSLVLCLFMLPALVWGNDVHVYTEPYGDVAYYEGKKLTGSCVEIVQEIMRRVGQKPAIDVVPWMRGYEAVKRDPDVALFATTLTPERKPQFQWVGPILRVQWVFLAQKDSGIVIESLDDARMVRAIGTYIGDVREEFLQGEGFTNLDSSPSNVMNLRKLALGRLDLVATSTLGMRRLVDEAGISEEDVEVVYVLREVDLYVAFSKQTEKATVERWRKAFESMRKDGTFKYLYNKWYPNLEAPLQPLP